MDAMMAKVRVEGEAETKKVGLGALRLVEERPSAAAIMLAHAVKYHRNDIVVQLLASPLMAAPLQFVVGAPDKNVAVRDETKFFPIPAGLTPMDVARTCGLPSRRDAVVAELTAAIAERAL